MTLLAVILGAVAGAGAVVWWQDDRPEPSPTRSDEHAVELVLLDAAPHGARPDALRVDAVLLLTGTVTSTVLAIGIPDRSVEVRAPDLPVTLSPSTRFHAVDLRILVRRCNAARRWTPVDRPFTVTWRDEFGQDHLDRAGDFGSSMTTSLTRYLEAVCGQPGTR